MSAPGSDQLRLAIRELLAEELAKLRGGQGEAAGVRVEPVSLRDDRELGAFVAHLGRLYADRATRADIEAGRHVFRLSAAASPVVADAPRAGGGSVTLERKLVGEREVNALADGTRRVVVTRQTRFTPLAKDALRRRGISIERSPS